MKTLLLVTCLLLAPSSAFSQRTVTAKLYLIALPHNIFHTTLSGDKPIKINRCTLLETNADSLGIAVTDKKTVYLHFERGRTYYFRVFTSQRGDAMTTAISETEFWLDVGFNGAGVYRHYMLDKEKGLSLLESE